MFMPLCHYYFWRPKPKPPPQDENDDDLPAGDDEELEDGSGSSPKIQRKIGMFTLLMGVVSGAKVQPITTDNTNEWKRKTRPPCAEFRKTLTANLSETGTTTTNGEVLRDLLMRCGDFSISQIIR